MYVIENLYRDPKFPFGTRRLKSIQMTTLYLLILIEIKIYEYKLIFQFS